MKGLQGVWCVPRSLNLLGLRNLWNPMRRRRIKLDGFYQVLVQIRAVRSRFRGRFLCCVSVPKPPIYL